jgi:uncharacterized small protein (DUF1192 family)
MDEDHDPTTGGRAGWRALEQGVEALSARIVVLTAEIKALGEALRRHMAENPKP